MILAVLSNEIIAILGGVRMTEKTEDRINAINVQIVPPKEPSLSIMLENREILRFESNGDVLYEGNLIDSDRQIVEGMKKFLKGHNLY